MSELNFQWQKFKMENSAKDFLEKYISRIKKYAESHNISDDLVDDIYQSILDKLFDIKWDITQKKLVSIVNSIWEPEDIFEDDMDLTEKEEPKKENKSDLKPYEKWQKTNWTRPRDKSILLWVCAMFGQATVIPTRIWRIFVILWSRFFLATDMEEWFFFGCGVYLVLALIFPIKDKDYKHCSMLVYRWTQVRDLRLMIPNFFSRFFWLCKWFIKTAIPSTIKFLSRLFWPIWTFIKYSFLVCRSLFLIFVLVGLGSLLYYLIFGFIRWNIDYTTIFPWITKIWLILWIISAFILLLASIGSIFKKKLSNAVSLIIAIWCGVLAIIIAVISISEIYFTMNMIAWTDRTEIREKEITIQNKETPVHINIDRTVENEDFLIAENQFVSVLPSNNDKIKIVYTFHFKWKWEDLTTAIENISDVDYSWNWDTLNIWLKNSEIFSKVTPFIPTTIEIDLYLPKNLDFDFQNSGIRLINLDTPTRASWVGSVSVWDCLSIKYNSETDKFLCELSMGSKGRYNIARDNLQEIADEIVPLRWMNSVWSISYVWWWQVDWYRKLDSINVWDDSTLLAKFSDKFFNFFIEIEYNIDNETWEFTLIDSKIKQLEQKWLMDNERMSHYEWWENLSDFEIQMKDDEEDKIKKEQEIQNLQDRIKALEEKLDELTLDSSEN